jgi:hypothetical protein
LVGYVYLQAATARLGSIYVVGFPPSSPPSSPELRAAARATYRGGIKFELGDDPALPPPVEEIVFTNFMFRGFGSTNPLGNP